jgi:hypothetical protein
MERVCVVHVLERKQAKVTAMTDNISRSGAWLRLQDNTVVPQGTRVAVEILLDSASPAQGKCIYCRGIVSRVEEHAAGSCIGVRFERMGFRGATGGV